MVPPSIPRKAFQACLAASMLLAASTVAAMAGAPGTARSIPPVATHGELAPNAPFTPVDGNVRQLDAYKGHPVIVW
ncbi:hypothetical protein [Pandoraea sp.]|uniref:hypothetical protein n=1 Tax=Pandoraea sp. TaxID=1883445 RepID=UPI0025E6D023|nr:hypothetical protein [Pandoraea sp.]